MGRFVDKESPISAATAVLMPVTTTKTSYNYAFLADTYGGFEKVRSGTLTATSSVTLLALAGPGVISHFQVRPASLGSTVKIAIWIDDELAYEQSVSMTANISAVTPIGAVFGGTTNHTTGLLDPIPFKSRVLVTLETTATTLWETSTHYRLTD